ncbi:hypothetical protein [Hamadaea tsunoensis]|uniref:hypothetical protein n=1 Tax=Hamadaea tsunoensis TaxID=53368 RepID=UPI0012F71F01|nr:hypothetical protein [Hamadaea tsunoensis]
MSSGDLVRAEAIENHAGTLAALLRRHEGVLVCPEPEATEFGERPSGPVRLLVDALCRRLPGHKILPIVAGLVPDRHLLAHARDLVENGCVPVVVTPRHSVEACAVTLHDSLAADAVFDLGPGGTLRLLRSWRLSQRAVDAAVVRTDTGQPVELFASEY